MRQCVTAMAAWLPPRFLPLGLPVALLFAAALSPGMASAQRNENEPPTFSRGSIGINVPENSPAGAQVGIVQANDPEGDSLRYSLGRETDARSFAIDNNGRLTVAQGAVLNYERQRTFRFTVSVTDGKGRFGNSDNRKDAEVLVTVYLTDVDEPGEILLIFNQMDFPSLSPDRPYEDWAVSANVIEPDQGHDFSKAEWEWEVSPDKDADDDDWALAAASCCRAASHYTPPAAVVGNYLRVTVSYAYDTDLPDLQKITKYPVKALKRDNLPPSFGVDVFELFRYIPENSPAGTTIIAPVTATDNEGDTLTYSLSHPYFSINESTGYITFTGGVNIDYDKGPRKFDLTVGVTDGKDVDGNADNTIDATVHVFVEASNVDEPGSVSFRLFSDPAPRQGIVTTATLSDPDRGATTRNRHTIQWKWETSADKSDWSQVHADSGSQISEYTPTAADEGKYLRAAVSYNGVLDDKQTAQVVSAYPVLPPVGWNPPGLKVRTDIGSATLSWDNPNDPNILRYRYIQSTGDSGGEWADIPNSDKDTTQFTIDGLTNGVHYSWSVGIVHNIHGTRLRPAVTAAIVRPYKPASPSGLTSQPGNGSVVISWNNPGDSYITGYQYARAGDSANGWQTVPNSDKDTTQFTVTGLANGVTYVYFIRAVNKNTPGHVHAIWVTPNSDGQASQQIRPDPGSSGKILMCKEDMIGRRLYKDCSTLLSVKDTLDSESILNWDVLLPIPQWDGLLVKGKPKRVKRIELADWGLVGSIPADLRRLNGMTHLKLNGNNLTDTCMPAAIADRLKVSKPKPCAGE